MNYADVDVQYYVCIPLVYQICCLQKAVRSTTHKGQVHTYKMTSTIQTVTIALLHFSHNTNQVSNNFIHFLADYNVYFVQNFPRAHSTATRPGYTHIDITDHTLKNRPF